ncbi:heat shock protein, Hsp20 family [hydrothermal vent metagenome]|jgi:HSP20 family protein|uniref:Heat shock protein, Hsp20 family n=1 Tax=hydrothermal vent metagenome TaxID=652676 RepID=A0A1W1D764_9ZZZZ
MSLTLMRPFAEMDKMFEDFDRPLIQFDEGDWMPAVDIEESDKAYLVRAELPGVHKDDVHVVIENNVLTIKGEKRVEIEDTKRHRVERSYGSFVRSFTLPHTVKTTNIKAEYVDGVLNLTIAKVIKAKTKQIEVKIK